MDNTPPSYPLSSFDTQTPPSTSTSTHQHTHNRDYESTPFANHHSNTNTDINDDHGGVSESARGDLGVHGGENTLITGPTTTIDTNTNDDGNSKQTVNVNGRGESTRTTVGTGIGIGTGTVVGVGVGVGGYDDWEIEYERQRTRGWDEKIQNDLKGWRGGHGSPRSNYPRAALPPLSYFHQPITGEIDKHLPKEIVRIERDWSGGEVCQFDTVFPMELEGRIKPAAFTSFINQLNTHLSSAYSSNGAIIDNLVAVITLWTSLFWRKSHFDKELSRAEEYIQQCNMEIFNQKGLNVKSPRSVALQFLEIEYY